MKTVYSFLILLFFVQISYAQDSVVVFQSNVSEIMTIPLNNEDVTVSSSTKIEQSIAQAPNLISSIGRKQIAEYGFVSLNDIVYRQAGVAYSQDFDRSTLSLRGNFESWNNNHWLMLVDGLPFNENTFGSALTSEFTPLIFTKSVEVIRGAGSALYGTNAMNGVISMNTLNVADLKGNAETRIRFGNQGLRIYDGIVGAESKKVEMIIAFNHYQNDGTNYMTHDVSGRTNPDGSLKEFQSNNAKNSDYIFAKLTFKGKLRGLSLQYHEQLMTYSTGVGWSFSIPDQAESMQESKRIFSLTYKTDASKRLSAEFSTRYQKRAWNFNFRPLNDSAYYYGSLYPNGVTELLQMSLNDVFTRMQLSYRFENSGVLLAGIENTAYHYDGDKSHSSNVNLNGDFSPNDNNTFLPVNEFYGPVSNRWIINTGIYGQYVSPKLLNEKFSITAGLRYDFQPADYKNLLDSNQIVEQKSFEKLSPRLSLVYEARKNLYFKAMAGRAFRVPSYSELYAVNTFVVSANPKQLVPETSDTYEFAADWQATKSFDFRANVFYNKFQNLIAYSPQNNSLNTNMYTLTNIGAEAEIIWTGKQEKKHQWSGFFNYGITKRVNEVILDSLIAESSQITWLPAQTAKLGVIYKHNKFYVSSIITYQGKAFRRNSDTIPALSYSNTEIDVNKFRPAAVSAWTSVDLKVGYNISKHFEIGFMVNNLFDTKRYLTKSGAYPMDYLMPQRLVMLDLKINY